jgi:acyl-CoA thioesterase
MKESLKKAIRAQAEREPYSGKLGMRLIDFHEGFAKVEMDVTPELTNILGMFHGGAIFSLIDEAFQVAGNSHGTVAVALNMSISYLAAPEIGSRLTAEAREFHRTRRTAHYEIKVTDDKEKLIATSQALTYRKGDPLPFL